MYYFLLYKTLFFKYFDSFNILNKNSYLGVVLIKGAKHYSAYSTKHKETLVFMSSVEKK